MLLSLFLYIRLIFEATKELLRYGASKKFFEILLSVPGFYHQRWTVYAQSLFKTYPGI